MIGYTFDEDVSVTADASQRVDNLTRAATFDWTGIGFSHDGCIRLFLKVVGDRLKANVILFRAAACAGRLVPAT